MRFKFPVHLIFLFLFVVIFSSQQLFVFGQLGLNLEWEQHWEVTYGVGGTCNFGTHNFFVGDIDQAGLDGAARGVMEPEIEAQVRVAAGEVDHRRDKGCGPAVHIVVPGDRDVGSSSEIKPGHPPDRQ